MVIVSAIPPPPPGAITIDGITAPLDPQPLGTTTSVSASFAGTATTATWSWGDGTQSAGTIVAGAGGGAVTGTHTYADAGVYVVDLTLASSTTSATAQFQYVVIYNPAAGFVTGDGWFTSPAGALASSLGYTGKAEFGFISRYKKSVSVPIGETEFKLEGDALKFVSTSYQYLVISGAKGQFKGEGMVNDQPGYGFMLTLVDGQLTGGGVDRLRVKIWEKTTDQLVYDNQLGASDSATPTTALGGENLIQLRHLFAVLSAVSEHSQGEGLYLRDRFFTCFPVGHHAR